MSFSILFLPFLTSSLWLLNGNILPASAIYCSTSVPGSTMISISVDNLRGLSSNNIKQVPPLKMNGIPTFDIASNNPKAYPVFSSRDGSLPLNKHNLSILSFVKLSCVSIYLPPMYFPISSTFPLLLAYLNNLV